MHYGYHYVRRMNWRMPVAWSETGWEMALAFRIGLGVVKNDGSGEAHPVAGQEPGHGSEDAKSEIGI